MKIVEQGADRLVLESRPIWLMILCAGLFLMFLVLGFGMKALLPAFARLAGFPDAPGLEAMPYIPGLNVLGYASIVPLLVAVFLVKARRFEFDRVAGRITIASRGVLGRSERTLPMASFLGAALQSTRSDEGGTTYRSVLQFSEGERVVPMVGYFTSGGGSARAVDAINAWLGPRVNISSGADITLSGDDAERSLAALRALGVRINPADKGRD